MTIPGRSICSCRENEQRYVHTYVRTYTVCTTSSLCSMCIGVDEGTIEGELVHSYIRTNRVLTVHHLTVCMYTVGKVCRTKVNHAALLCKIALIEGTKSGWK